MPRAGNEHVHPAVYPSIGPVDITQDEVMNLLQRPLSQRLIPLDKGLHVIDGMAMPYRLKMFSKALSTDGDAILQNRLGFAHGERVPFDGIGVVGEADTHVFPNLRDNIRRQGAMRIKAP